MTQDTPSLQVRCTSCHTSFKMKLKRGRIPETNVPCPKCNAPIDLSTYTESDLDKPSSGFAERLRPAAELLKTIIPQARIFDRNRRRKINDTGKTAATFHIQKGGAADHVDKPTGAVVGRFASSLEDANPVRFDPDDSREIDSGVLIKTPESTEIDVRSMPSLPGDVPQTLDHLDAPSSDPGLADDVSPLNDVLSFSDEELEELADIPLSELGEMPPARSAAPPAILAAGISSRSSVELPIAKPSLPKPAIPAPSLPTPKGAPNFAPPPAAAAASKTKSDKLPVAPILGLKPPGPISGLSESSEAAREREAPVNTVEISDALRVAAVKPATSQPETSIEIIRSAAFEGLEQEQADSFFKSSTEVAESLEFEIEEFDASQSSRAAFPVFPAIIAVLVLMVVIVGFITLT